MDEMFVDARRFENNRQGIISTQQREAWLKHIGYGMRLTYGTVPIAIVVGFYIGLWAGETSGSVNEDIITFETRAQLIGMWVFTAAIVGFMAIFPINELLKRFYYAAKIEDMSQKPIQTQDGAITWDGKHYTIVIGDKFYQSITGNVPAEPGLYRFNVVEDSNWVLSAQRKTKTALTEAEKAQIKTVVTALGFDADALNTNRAGKLATSQRIKLLWRFLQNTLAGAVIVVPVTWGLFYVTPYILAFFALPDAQSDLMAQINEMNLSAMMRDDSWEVFGLFVGIFFISLLTIGIFYLAISKIVQWLMFLTLLITGRVEKMTGILTRYEDFQLDDEGSAIYRRYMYVMAKSFFKVPYRAYKALEDPVNTSVYYLPAKLSSWRGKKYYLLVNIEVSDG